MAINPIYRESWQKANGWNVRTEFIAGGGEAAKYADRSVTDVTSVFLDVSGHKASFGDGIPFGVADAESCKFVIDYEKCPAGMQSAVVAQAASVSTSYFAAATVGKYRVPKYMPQFITSSYPRQPNLFMVWSDRGSSNGVVTGLSIAYGGSAWEFDATDVSTLPYYPAPMDTRAGSGLTIDYELTDGVISHVSVRSGGTGYKVGQQVKVVDLLVPERYAYFTVTSVQAPMWYLEFAGGQRLSPSTKYSTTPNQMKIEIEAIGIHKLAFEAITDLTTFTRQYMLGVTDSVGYEAARFAANDTFFPQSPYGGSPIYNFVYNKNTRKTIMLLNSANNLVHWHAPIGAIFRYLQVAFDEAFEFFMMEGYQGGSDVATNVADIFPKTTSKVKFMKPKAWDGNPVTQVELGETDGTLHGSAAQMNQIRFIFAVTTAGTSTYTNPDEWAGGLFTDFEDGLRKDCDSAWDLFKKLAEQFMLKVTPYYEVTGGLLKAQWNYSDPYATTLTATSTAYDQTVSDAAFEVNAETREAVKQHYYVTGEQTESVEVTSYTKSGKKIEMNNIFDIRYMTHSDGIEFVNDTILAPYLNLRGLFYLSYDAGPYKASQIVSISPRLTVSYLYTGTTYFDFLTVNPYAYTTDPKNPNYWLYVHSKSSVAFMQTLRDIQAQNDTGFGAIALFLASYFGIPSDTTSFGTIDYSSNNQTLYDMTRPLSVDTIAQMIGQRIDITPHSALAGQVSPKAYATEIEVDWTAKDTMSDYVKVKYLTRNIRTN